MTRQQVLDLYFLDARHRLIEVAAFMDRMERASGEADFRYEAFVNALVELGRQQPDKASRLLLAFSDPTTEPVAVAPGKSACGAWRVTAETAAGP
jgi:hypothetical protein